MPTQAAYSRPDPAPGERVIVALSGGVDSAVAALLLRERGLDVHGLFMNNWDEADAYCTGARDYQDARTVAHELGIVLHRVDFVREYRAQVFEHFLGEMRAGRTPNPDVLCNREIKFGICQEHAQRLGGRWLATGHYARLDQDADGCTLLRGADAAKDQSYFLHAVPRQRFDRVLFPLGALTKEAVRACARRAGLPVHAKPDSTGICFIGERPFAQFLKTYVNENPGPIETRQGERIGTHRGLPFYTLGQRAGLQIGGLRGAAEEPWYVARKIFERNALIVVQRHEHEALESAALRTQTPNWLIADLPREFRAGVKVRYRQSDQPALIRIEDDGTLHIRFDTPQRAVTPGQSAVLYQGPRCLGGAVITDTLESDCP